MHSLAKTFVPLALAWVALDAATASAGVEERDHRRRPPQETPPPPPPDTRPDVRDHRAPPSNPPPRRYRRRPGPRIMLPLKVDIGMVGSSGDKGFMPGVEIRAGVHWASLSPTPTMWDVGLGVFGAAMIGPDDGVDATDDDVVIGGGYLEVGKVLDHGRFWRTWAAGRGEYFSSNTFGEEDVGFGAAGRVSAELYLSGVGIEPRGIFLGTYAVGVYAEVAARAIDKDVVPIQASLGLTFRTPLVWTP